MDQFLGRVTLSPQQVSHLFVKLRNTEELKFSEMKYLRINISQVAPAVLAEVIVTQLEDVDLILSAAPTPEQLAAIFTLLASQQIGDFKLKHLQFEKLDMTAISPENLVKGIQKLEKTRFDQIKLTADQINAMLSMISEGRQGRLNTLFIDHPDVIGTISPTLLQTAKEAGGRILDILLLGDAEDEDEDEDSESFDDFDFELSDDFVF